MWECLCCGADWGTSGCLPSRHRLGAGNCYSHLSDRFTERGSFESSGNGEHGSLERFSKTESASLHTVAIIGAPLPVLPCCIFCLAMRWPSMKRRRALCGDSPEARPVRWCLGSFFPAQGGHPLTMDLRMKMSPIAAFGAEIIGTAILLMVIFCVTDNRNKSHPPIFTAVTIGLTVTLLISLLGPLDHGLFQSRTRSGTAHFLVAGGLGALCHSK